MTVRKRGIGHLACALVLACLLLSTTMPLSAQEAAPLVIGLARPDPASRTMHLDLRVSASGTVSDFQAIILFDPLVLRFRSLAEGAFLKSTGRDSVCDKTIDSGAVRIECAIAPSTSLPAPSGLGQLATLDFDSLSNGEPQLTLSRVVIRDGDGVKVAPNVQQPDNTPVQVPQSGSSSSPWRIAIIVAAVASGVLIALLVVGVLIRRRRDTGPVLER
jgi:hypothetical protein